MAKRKDSSKRPQAKHKAKRTINARASFTCRLDRDTGQRRSDKVGNQRRYRLGRTGWSWHCESSFLKVRRVSRCKRTATCSGSTFAN